MLKAQTKRLVREAIPPTYNYLYPPRPEGLKIHDVNSKPQAGKVLCAPAAIVKAIAMVPGNVVLLCAMWPSWRLSLNYLA